MKLKYFGITREKVFFSGHIIALGKEFYPVHALINYTNRFLGFHIVPFQKYNSIPFTNSHIGIIFLDIIGIVGCLIAFIVILRKYIRKEPLFFK
ncbi:MAG: hypothetical protein ACFFDT_40910 [Candidatus Hodarchaeota archaeon]